MLRIALRNLTHDRMRLVAALLGVAFSVVLITFQVGVFHRFINSASAIIDHSGAPIWITSPGVANFEYGSTLNEAIYEQARAVPGVARVQRMLFTFARFRMPTGSYEGVQLIGLDLSKGSGIPWAFAAGCTEDLRVPEAVAIDDTDLDKLGEPRLGEYVELNDRRARVVALTHDHRSLIASPFIFTSLDNAYRFASRIRPGDFTYLLVTPEKGADLEGVRERLGRIPRVDVLTAGELARRSQSYWVFRTGAGFAIGISTILALVVGTVIVGQTIYSSTIDRLKEFGTLKAMGAANRQLLGLILWQALIYAGTGYPLGMAASHGMARLARSVGSPIHISPLLVAAMFLLTVLMCIAASVLSIARVLRVEPAMVFKA